MNKEMSLYLFYGSEIYLVDEAIQQILKKYINDVNINFNYKIIEGNNINVDDFINDCETLPFLGEKRIVTVKNSGLFASNSNLDAHQEDALIHYFPQIPSTTIVIFNEEKDIDKRKRIYREFSKFAEVKEFKKLSKDELIKWIKKRFNNYKVKASLPVIEEFIDITGYDERKSEITLYHIENEIKKLSDYVGTNNEINREDLYILTPSLERNIFDLVDAISDKKGDLAVRILNQLLISGEQEGMILNMIVRQFKILNTIKHMLERGYTASAIYPRFSNLPKFIIQKYIKQTYHFTIEDLLKIYNILTETDFNVKSGNISSRLGLEVLIAKCVNI